MPVARRLAWPRPLRCLRWSARGWCVASVESGLAAQDAEHDDACAAPAVLWSPERMSEANVPRAGSKCVAATSAVSGPEICRDGQPKSNTSTDFRGMRRSRRAVDPCSRINATCAPGTQRFRMPSTNNGLRAGAEPVSRAVRAHSSPFHASGRNGAPAAMVGVPMIVCTPLSELLEVLPADRPSGSTRSLRARGKHVGPA